MKPRGATEIQHEFLEKYVDKDLLSKFQICTSIPGKVPLDPNKINIAPIVGRIINEDKIGKLII